MDAIETITEAVPGLVSASNIARIEFDGSCEAKNPGGVATGGWRLLIGDTLIHERGEFFMEGPQATNNVAEYYALGRALASLVQNLDYPKKLGVVNLQIVGDSQLVVYQIDGTWKCNKPHLEQLRDRCRELIAAIESEGIKVTLAWIPRERNEAADRLSQQAYVTHTGKPYPVRKR